MRDENPVCRTEAMDNLPGGFLICRRDRDGALLRANRELLRILRCGSVEDLRALTEDSLWGMIRREDLPYQYLRWIENDEEGFDPKKLLLSSDTKIVQDFQGRQLLLFTSAWNITWATDKNPRLRLAEFSTAE